MTEWNERYLKGDTPWDKDAPAPPLLEFLEKRGTDLFGSDTVLVPGCGTGHDVRALAGKGLNVIGVDVASEALKRASSFDKVGTETYEEADFLSLKWQPAETISAIWEHTCFCAIDPSCRTDYAKSCARLLESGEHLIGVFFLTPYDPGEEEDGPPFATSIDELDETFSPYFERIDGWVPERAYPGREGREWLAVYRRK